MKKKKDEVEVKNCYINPFDVMRTWDPWDPFAPLRDNSIYKTYTSNNFNLDPTTNHYLMTPTMPTTQRQFENSYNVKYIFDVPGFSSQYLTIEIDEDVLSVSGERNHYTLSKDKDDDIDGYVRKINFKVVLPEGLDTDSGTPTLEDGVLTVEFRKKSKEDKPRPKVLTFKKKSV